jgi:peptidoglycan-associated lipoprotein
MNGEIDEAREALQEYLKAVPDDLVAQRSLQACDSIQVWEDNPTRYQVENIRDFNSRENDFSPAFAGDDYRELYFTSSRDGAEGNKPHGATGESFTDIFLTRLDNKMKWTVPTPIDKTVNTMYEDGTPWISPDGGTMYFTRCRFDKEEELGCQILVSESNGGQWKEPTIIPISNDSVIIAHPSLTDDELNMYFVSNLFGGYGGKDIWKVSRESKGGDWGEPENIGPDINTPGNEMFPTVRGDSTLYFSSDGHLGMGGLDIFKADLQPDGSWKVENMKYPINSTGDDFGMVFQRQEEQGYFSSNRQEDSRGGDDIYSFLLPTKKFSIAGTVLNEETTEPVNEADVRLIGSDGTNLEYATDSTGKFSFKLRPETDYIVVSLKKGYLNAKVRETTVGIPESRDFDVTLLMAPIERPIELPNILYDLAKWDLRPESMVALDELVETLEDNPNITIELMSHTDVRPFRTMSNLELSQNRAQSVVDYLISKGIATDRLEARGYGPEVPRVIDEKLAQEYDFLNAGDTLTKGFIEALPDQTKQEIAHQLNRRTEFRVLSTDYVAKPLRDQNMDVNDQILKMGQDELMEGKKGEGAFDKSKKEEALEKLKKTGAEKGEKKEP